MLQKDVDAIAASCHEVEVFASATPLCMAEYQLLVEQAPILIWRSDTRGSCDYFNRRWLEFRGRELHQEYGNGWAEGVHPDDHERCLRTFLDSFHSRVAFQMEYRLCRYDGIYRWIFDCGGPFYLPSGAFGGYIGSCIDVTDRVEAQEALARKRLDELNDLQSLLPICSYCRKVRDDNGYWAAVEDYISTHTPTEFSHGICPSCMLAMDPAGRCAEATQRATRLRCSDAR